MGAGLQTTVTGPTYDPDAQLFFNAQTAAGVTLTTTQKNAVNQWVVDAKAAGIWTKFKAVYPMVGGTATAHKFNLKNPADTNAAFRLNFVGGWTHSSNGALPNGTNAYAQTYLTPSISLSINNSHISFYSRTNYNTISIDIGSQQVGNTPSLAIGGMSTYEFYRINDYTFSTVSTVNSLGFRLGSRSSSTVKKMVSNNSITDTNVTSTGIPNQSLLIGAYQDNGGINYYSARQCAFASIGDGLTDAEALSFYNAVQTFQTTLGRQV